MQIINKLEMFHAATDDMDATKEFYESLGFKVTNDQSYGDKRWISLEFPGGGTSINFATVHENMKPGTLKLYISSPDVEAAYNEILSKDIKPTKELADDWGKWNGQGEGGKWFELTDPSGNHLLVIPKK